MANDFGLEDPLYEKGRVAVYPDERPDEHQMVIDNTHYVTLPRGAVDSISRGEKGAMDYVMRQIPSVDILEEEVVQGILRARIAQLETYVGDLV